MKITIEFNINPADLAEYVADMGYLELTPEDNLVTLLQHVLYDNSDGPQLEGHFNVKEELQPCTELMYNHTQIRKNNSK